MDATYYAKTLAAYGGYLAAFVVGGLGLYWATLPDGVQQMALGAGVVILADMLSGSLVALQAKRFSSSAAKGSLFKLATYSSGLLLGYGVDVALGLGSVCVAAILVVVFLIEATSVIENLGTLGLPIPAVIRERLEALKKAQEVDGNGGA